MDRKERNRIKILTRGVQRELARRVPRPNLGFPWVAPTSPYGVEPAPVEPDRGEHFDTDWARRPGFRAARAAYTEAVLRPMVAVLANPDRTNVDRLVTLNPDEGAIFVANHHSHVDTPLMITSLPDPWRHRLVVGAAADHFFESWRKGTWAAFSLNAIPMERTRASRLSINRAAELISDGWGMLLYPEGGRSEDGWGSEFKNGAAYLAQRCDVPIVPVHIRGTSRILKKGDSVPTPSKTTVNFGTPLHIEPDESSRAFTARIETAVSVLADETETDWWTARKNQHAEEVPSLQGPDASTWRRQWALGESTARRKRERSWPNV